MSIVKPYTVVKRLTDEEDSSSSEKTIELLIKHYADRALTPMLQQLTIGIEHRIVVFVEEPRLCFYRV
jgi:hypothetical protein